MRTPRSVSVIVALVVVFAGATLYATTSVTVSEGDTLSAIAARHGVRVVDLVEWNEIDDPDRIFVGDLVLLAAPADRDEPSHHVVSAGDTLSLIARRYGASVAALADANGLADPDVIRIGQRLTLSDQPATAAATEPEVVATEDARTHTVAPGETLFAIALRYDRSVASLVAANELSDPDRIRSGQALRIPTADEEPIPTADPTDGDPDSAGEEPITGDPATDDAGTETGGEDEPDAPAAPSPDAEETPEPDPEPEAPAEPADPAAPPQPSTSASELARAFDRWALSYGVDQSLLEALTWHASDWQPGTVGADGRLGIGQLTQAQVDLVESRLLGLDLDPLDTSDGIRLAARYLRYVQDRTHDDHEAVTAFRQGLSSFLSDGADDDAVAFADEVLAIRDQRS